MRWTTVMVCVVWRRMQSHEVVRRGKPVLGMPLKVNRWVLERS